MKQKQTECKRCGICCQKGGPALHGPDLALVRGGRLPMENLITIRRGELAYNPLSDAIEPVGQELVKIRGTGQEWSCCYYEPASKGCSIYGGRPLACGVLKCWQPEETLALVGQDLLSRLDILGAQDPLRPLVLEHERLCPCPDLGEVKKNLAAQDGCALRSLEGLVNTDLAFRDRVVREFNLLLAHELFLFGRPLFQLLQASGVPVSESRQGLKLTMRRNGNLTEGHR
ncbi:MAG: YkgJ family cysteine cluster protein [Desulfoarculaceae bacterium]|nr:YkgJ family cysteine cluster protein [Desulfoarculaceae bacterium]